ncbi:trace amine-associated receptor 1-like [Mastacembelus armatus]|uniref:trace amine-associated receptor 1-like n=1 Tax=Mastacembelus armatus TaxID=205130 RepID=UPI000E4570F7|nr:trace amine-associated receptor 1-like [Mastacembelus armatus]
MSPEVNVNSSNADDTPLCYAIHKVSYILISSPSTICVLLHIVLGSLSVVTVCGNLLVIISITYFKQLHTATNSLVLSLAVTDLLVGVLVFPLSMVFNVSSCLYHDSLFCKIRGSCTVSLCTASILNLCCISIDRYYAVCQPLTYRTKINVHVVVVMIFGTWTVSVVVALGFLISGLNQEKCEETCFIDVVLPNILAPVFSFYLPMIVMLCIYLKIFLVAQKQARSIQNTTCQSLKSRATVSKMERKATKTLATVMGVFLMCWTPFFLCFAIQLLSHVSVPVSVFETLSWLALSNSTLNPFIYAFFYSWFRAAFRIIISGKIFRGDFAHTKLL